jgi:hypothetical protein
MNQQSEMPNQSTETEPKERPVNENVGFYLSTMIKIHDPNTKQVLVQKRGDN